MRKSNDYTDAIFHIGNRMPKEQQMTANDVTAEALSLKTVTIEVNDHKVEMPAGRRQGSRSRKRLSSRMSKLS